MVSRIKILVFIIIAVTMTSCYNYRSVGLLQDNNFALPKYKKADFEVYKLRVNDELVYRLISSDETISRLINADNSGGGSTNILSYRIYPDGTIDIPFVKQVKVAGLTLKEAALVLENRFKELIPDAAIKLSIMNRNFTVIGEAGVGVYNIPRDKFTIYQALSMSGELNHAGDFKHVKILREKFDGTEVLEFDIRPTSIIDSKYYYIYPNDIIYIQRSKASFYKIENNWGSFLGLISTSLSLFFSVLYYNKL